MTVKLSLSAAAMFLALNNGNAYAVTATEQLDTLLSEHWQQANKEQIFFRKDPDTFRMNGKLPDVSAKGRERREQYNAQLLKRLDSIDERQLSEADKITLRLFKYERQTEAQSYKQFDHLFRF